MKEAQEPTVELSDDVVEKMIQRHNESLSMNPELHVNFGGQGYTFPYQSQPKHSFSDSFGMIMLGLTIFAIIIATWLLS